MAYDYAYDDSEDWGFLLDDEEVDDSEDWSFLLDDEPEPEPQEEDDDAWDYAPTPAPVEEIAPVAPIKEEDPETQYNTWGALKHSAWQTAKAVGGGLPSAVGRMIPGEDWFEKVGKENKKFYDDIMGDDEEIKDYVKSVQNESEGFATEVLGNIGPTAAGLGMSVIPYAGPVLAVGMFYDLNTSEIEDMATAKGADKETAEKIGVVGGVVNSALDMTGLGFLKRAFKPGSKAVTNKLTNWLIGLGITSVGEGGTEGLQGIIGEIASDYAAKPKEETTEQFTDRMFAKKDELLKTAWHDASIGAATGGGIHTIASGVKPFIQNPAEEDTPDPSTLIAEEAKAIHPENAKDQMAYLRDPEIKTRLLEQGFTDGEISAALAEVTPLNDKDQETLTTVTDIIDRLDGATEADLQRKRVEDFTAKVRAGETEFGAYSDLGLTLADVGDVKIALDAEKQLADEAAAEAETQEKEAKETEAKAKAEEAKKPADVTGLMKDLDSMEDGTKATVQQSDEDGKNVTDIEVDAKTEVADMVKRKETFEKIINCLGSK